VTVELTPYDLTRRGSCSARSERPLAIALQEDSRAHQEKMT
jgi:hypothetical protein